VIFSPAVVKFVSLCCCWIGPQNIF